MNRELLDRVTDEKMNSNGAMSTAVPILEKWNREADAAFHSLPFEKKAALLASLE